jgi:ribosomal protein S18 acetylase RimI-like enzyme
MRPQQQEHDMERTDSTDLITPPAGYLARAATADDASAVAALRTAYQAAEGDPTNITPEEQLNDWQGLNLADDALVVLAPDGGLAACADVANRRFMLVSVYGGVHPRHGHRGLGTLLVRWGEAWTHDHMDRAPADAQIAVQYYINAKNEPAHRLLRALGYTRVRTIYVMRTGMDRPPEAAEPVEGLRIRTFVPGQDERAAFDAREDAFRDLWGRPAAEFEGWLRMTEGDREHPELWLLAEDERSGEIAGVCLARLIPGGGGWIRSVGVRRPWRQRGLALSLLQTVFGEFYRRGERDISLSVDAESPSGAPRLYTRAGMRVDQDFDIYRKQLRAGKDYTALAAAAEG